jgi:hypothetical protein
MRPRSQTWDPEQGIYRLHHCATLLVVLTCHWSSKCSLCGQVDLYIGYIPIPCKWKQICACWTCDGGGGNGGSPVCYGGSGFLLEARRSPRWNVVALASVFIVYRGRGDRSDPHVSFLAFSCSLHCFGPCLNMRYTRNIAVFQIWLGQ